MEHRGQRSLWRDVEWYSRRNINAPMIASNESIPLDPTAALLAPHPIEPHENIPQLQNTANAHGAVSIVTLSQQTYKYVGVNASYTRSKVNANSDMNDLDMPQSPIPIGESRAGRHGKRLTVCRSRAI